MNCPWTWWIFWLVVVVVEIGVLGIFLHYFMKANPTKGRNEYRYIDETSLDSYTRLALEIGGFGAATLWAVLPVVFDTQSRDGTPLLLKATATFLVLGTIMAGIFIMFYYRFYELAGRPKGEEDCRLENWQLGILFFLGVFALTGVLQGAIFLVAGIWDLSVLCVVAR